MVKWADHSNQPRKPATPKQEIARTVNWALVVAGGADANLGITNYKLEKLWRTGELTHGERLYLQDAAKAMQRAQDYAVLACQSLHHFNELRRKNHG